MEITVKWSESGMILSLPHSPALSDYVFPAVCAVSAYKQRTLKAWAIRDNDGLSIKVSINDTEHFTINIKE